MQKIQKIYYTNSFPGSGKTHWAIAQMKNHLAKEISKDSHLIIYCAPTKELLSEVYNKLTDNGTRNTDRVTIVYRDKQVDVVSSAIENGYEVYYDIKQKLQQNKPFNLSDIVALHNPSMSASFHAVPIIPGGILLITHEAFWGSNHNLKSKHCTFKDRENTTLVIDEARDCYIKTLSFKFSAETAERFKAYLQITDANQQDFVSINPKLLRAKSLIANGFDINAFQSYGKYYLTQLNMLSRKSNINVFAYFKYTKEISTFSITFVRAPYDALFGWGKIFTLAAFYSDSQLYHLLQTANADETSQYKFKQIDITDKVINQKHLNDLRKRFKQTEISYVYEGYLSANKLNNYVPYIYHEDTFDDEKFTAALNASFNKYAEIAPKVYTLTQDSFFTFLKYTDISTISYTNYLDKYGQQSIDYSSNHIVPCNGTAFAALYSDQLIKNWGKQHELYENKYLLCINNKQPYVDKRLHFEAMLDKGIEKPKDITFETSTLPTIETWNNSVPKAVKTDAVPVIGDIRGLNKFKSYNAISVISSYRAHPQLLRWFMKYCPTYNSELDFTIGQTIQVMMRCAIRDTSSKVRCLIVLNSSAIAKMIHSRLEYLPEFITPTAYNMPSASMIYPAIPGLKKQEINEEVIELHREAARKNIKRKRSTFEGLFNEAKQILSEDAILKDVYISDALKNYDLAKNAARIALYRANKSNLEYIELEKLEQKYEDAKEEYKEKRKEALKEYEKYSKLEIETIFAEAIVSEYEKRKKRVIAMFKRINLTGSQKDAIDNLLA